MKPMLTALVFAAAVWSVLLGPMRAEVGALHVRIAESNAELERRRTAASVLRDVEREVRELESELDGFRALSVVPVKDWNPITHLQSVAATSRVRISALRPRAELPAIRGGGQVVELGIEGSFHDLGRFLGRLAAAPRVMTASEVSVRARPATQAGAANLAASVMVSVFDLSSDDPRLDEELAYDDGGRRDPFAAATDERATPAQHAGAGGARGTRLGSTRLSDVVVRGIASDGTRRLAILETSGGRSFNVRALDRLADSVVHDITSSRVQFIRNEKETVSLPIHNPARRSVEPQ